MMPTRSSGLSNEQKEALKRLIVALREGAGLSFVRIGELTGIDVGAIQNFRHGKSQNAHWLPKLARGTATLTVTHREALRAVLPEIDELTNTLTGGVPPEREPPQRKRLMRDAARAFLHLKDEDAKDIARRFGDRHYLCYRYSSQAGLMVCTALKVTGLDRTAKMVTFAHVYRSLQLRILRTGGVVVRQGERDRICLLGNTQRGAGTFTMVLNTPRVQGASLNYMNGLMMGLNAPGNILAARVLCIPTGEERSARDLHADPRVGAWPIPKVHAEIRRLLPRLKPSEQDVVLQSLSNAAGAPEVLVLGRA